MSSVGKYLKPSSIYVCRFIVVCRCGPGINSTTLCMLDKYSTSNPCFQLKIFILMREPLYLTGRRKYLFN